MKIVIRHWTQQAYRLLSIMGLEPRRSFTAVLALPGYLRDYLKFFDQHRRSTSGFRWGAPFPCLMDRAVQSGAAKGHYFHQDLFVANRVFMEKPERHIDVGSRVDGFVAHVASFRAIEVLDVRPLRGGLLNISFVQADLMSKLPAALVECCDSVSCLHALEHFGLGRYGDPLDYEGHVRGIGNLAAMLKPRGKLYLSVPIGPHRIEFNAHRVFGMNRILEIVADAFELAAFSYVDDAGDFHPNVPVTADDAARSFGCHYGCGIFELIKKSER